MKVNNTLLRLCFRENNVAGVSSAEAVSMLGTVPRALAVFAVIAIPLAMYVKPSFDGLESCSVPTGAAP